MVLSKLLIFSHQVMLILNILLVFWFNDKVLDGHFLKLGSNWIAAPNGKLSYNEIHDNKIPSREKMNKEELLFEIFPRRAECTVNFQGAGGNGNTLTHYCILGANSLAQYIFLVLWFWYALLLAIHVLNLIRIILMIQRFGRIRNIFLMSVVGSAKVIYQNSTLVIGRLFLILLLNMDRLIIIFDVSA